MSAILGSVGGDGKCSGPCPKCGKENMYFSYTLDGSGFKSKISCLEQDCDYEENNGK